MPQSNGGFVPAASAAAAATNPRAVALGYVNWGDNPETATNSSAWTGGSLQANSIWLPAGAVVTGIDAFCVTVAAGTKPTGFWVGIADSTTKMVAQSGDLSGVAGAPFTATGPIDCALTSPYTTITAGLYYLVGLMVGTYGTTQPTFPYISGATGMQKGRSGQPIISGTASGQTGLPANGVNLPALAANAAFILAAY